MCGLVAALSRGGPLEAVRLEAALEALNHRGPDGRGTWRSADGRVVLGHTRLAIIDLETGAQPIASAGGALQLVVNGEFYDFERIRAGLQARGHRFVTRSDSEIALHLYEEHGLEFLHHLRGEFALVLWDGGRRRLVAARDRFGVKPLCWARTREGPWLASEAKALFAMGLEARWDPTSFLHAAAHQYLPPERTLFAGVQQVPPGCVLVADDASVRVHRYWDLDFPEESDRPRALDDAQAAEELEAVLDESVSLRLRADVPVAFALSGGIDSASVVALAARRGASPLPCFGVTFEHAPYDEESVARETAAHLGARFEPVRVRQRDLLEALPQAVVQSEGLAINGQLPAKLLLARAIGRAGFKVVLTGEGSDEALFGYAHLVHDALLGADDPAARSALARLDADSRASAGVMLPDGAAPDDLATVRAGLGFVPTFLAAKAGLGSRIRRLLRPDWALRGRAWDPFAALLHRLDVQGQLARRPPVAKSAYLWTRLALAGYILRTLGDGTEMAHSVEGRTPFLDHRFFEWARALPLAHKLRDGREKHVLRAAMRKLLPPGVVGRRKQPFLAPPLTLFADGSTAETLRDAVASRAFADQPFFDPRATLRLLEALPRHGSAERAAAEPALMVALCTAILQARFRPGCATGASGGGA